MTAASHSRFGRVGTLALRHPFFADGLLRGARFVLPDDAQRTLRAARLQARVHDGALHLLGERREGQPVSALTGQPMLWIGIDLSAAGPAGLANITLPPAAAGRCALRLNAGAFDALDAPISARLATGVAVVPLVSARRPLAVALHARGGGRIAGVEPVVVAGNAGTAALDARALPPGLYDAVEDDGDAPPAITPLLLHPALQAAGVPLVVGLRLAPALLAAATPPAWHVDLAVATQPLEYYVVARNFGEDEFAQLQVQDQGAAQDGRPPVAFDRIESDAFVSPQQLSADQLGAPAGARIALFRSQTAVPRRERARRHVALMRQGDVLIDHLPQPDAARALSRFVIHLAKP